MGPRKNPSKRRFKKPRKKEYRDDLTVIWDADNTLWNWTKMHIAGMYAMADEIARHTGRDVAEVKASMRQVYSEAGTFDHKPLVQNMDIVLEWVKSFKSQDEGLKEFADLLLAVHNVYTHSRRNNFELFPEVKYLLGYLSRGKVRQIIMSDAPVSRVVRRSKFFKIDRFFSGIYARPDPKPEGKLVGDLSGYEDARKRHGYYDFKGVVSTMEGQKKPNINISKEINHDPAFADMTENELSRRTIVIGDNIPKDMGLASRNSCYGFWAKYGMPSEEQRGQLAEFGNEETVKRNADPSLTEAIAEIITSMKGRFHIIENMSDRRITRATIEEIFKVNHSKAA